MTIGTTEVFPDGNEYKLVSIKNYTKGKLIGLHELWHRKVKKTNMWTNNPSFLVKVED